MKRIDDVWDACPERELVRLATALRRTQILRFLGRAAAVLAVSMIGFTLMVFGAKYLGL